jgi:excisionase family DNA binding protein
MEQLLTIRDVAKILQLTERSVRERVKRGTIPFMKLDGAIRFKPDEIDKWLKSKESGPACCPEQV